MPLFYLTTYPFSISIFSSLVFLSKDVEKKALSFSPGAAVRFFMLVHSPHIDSSILLEFEEVGCLTPSSIKILLAHVVQIVMSVRPSV